jgi:Tfp pilus assembly protein PilN
MMGMRAGLYMSSQRLTVAVLGRSPQCFTLDTSDAPGARLKAELESRQVTVRRMRLGLARSLVTVKTLDLPRAIGGSQREMVAFELERHVPFAPEDIRFDFLPLPSPAKGVQTVLVAACERRTADGALRLLEEARLKPAALTAACHDLPALLAHSPRVRRAIWAHVGPQGMDLLGVGQGRVWLSRTVPGDTAETLVREVPATLAVLGWDDCEALWISGERAADLAGAPELADLGLPVSEPPWSPATRRVLDKLPEEGRGEAILAVAAARGTWRPALNLLPEELRPRTVTVGQLVTAAMVVVTAGLGLSVLAAQGYQQQRYATRLSEALRAIDPEVKAVERLSADLQSKKKLLGTIEAIEKGDVRPLPVLRELADRLPQDAWLRTLNMDRQGVEMSGQATAANQLIPLLEASPMLSKVEFTGPVTKAGDKEQFRIKAAWKAAAPGPVEPQARSGPAPAGPEPRATAPRPARGARPGQVAPGGR